MLVAVAAVIAVLNGYWSLSHVHLSGTTSNLMYRLSTCTGSKYELKSNFRFHSNGLHDQTKLVYKDPWLIGILHLQTNKASKKQKSKRASKQAREGCHLPKSSRQKQKSKRAKENKKKTSKRARVCWSVDAKFHHCSAQFVLWALREFTRRRW